MTATTARPTLPVWPTVSAAFASVLENWLAAVRIYWAWGVIAWVGYMVMMSVGLTHDPAASATPVVLVMLLFSAALLLAFASTAVGWHRLMLLGEQPPAIYLRTGGQVPPYIGRLLLILLIALPILLVSTFILGPVIAPRSPANPLAASLAGLVVFSPALVVTIRLSVSLPGIAVGRHMTLGEAWALTRRCWLQLLGGTLLFYVPSIVIGLSGHLLPISPTSVLLAMVVIAAVNIVTAIAAISFLSLSYRFLVSEPQAVQPQQG